MHPDPAVPGAGNPFQTVPYFWIVGIHRAVGVPYVIFRNLVIYIVGVRGGPLHRTGGGVRIHHDEVFDYLRRGILDIAEHSVAVHVDGIADAVVAEQGDCIGVQRKVNRAFNAIAKGYLFKTGLENKYLAGAAVLRVVDLQVEDGRVSGKGGLGVRHAAEVDNDVITGKNNGLELFQAEGTEHVKIQRIR